MKQDAQPNSTLLRALLWSGVVMVASIVVMQGFVMGFIPPPSPALSAREIADRYAQNQFSMILGSATILCSFTLYSTWVVPITVMIRRMEKGTPVLTIASIVNNGLCAVIVFVIPIVWTVTAYRAGTVPAEITQYSNDIAWFIWVFTFPPFSMWMLIIATAIFMGPKRAPVYPRWLAYYNIATAIFIAPTGLVGFFKSGPLAYNGVIAFWIDATIFFLWMITMTVMTFRTIGAQERLQSTSETNLSAAPV
jgi:hypothetical protein